MPRIMREKIVTIRGRSPRKMRVAASTVAINDRYFVSTNVHLAPQRASRREEWIFGKIIRRKLIAVGRELETGF